MSIEILWEDKTSLVVNKPAGILTQGAIGIETLETRLQSFIKLRDQHPGQPYIAFPHRIDRPVSGVVLVARNHRAIQKFGGQFQSRKVLKKYWAIVEGELPVESGTWIDFLRKIPDQPVGQVVDSTHPEGRQAVLHFTAAERLSYTKALPVTRVIIELETGRMHQIRLQFASRGFPLLGDSLYGSRVPFGPAVEDERQRSIALHAKSICFRHPTNGREVLVDAPLPESWSPESWSSNFPLLEQ